MKNTCPYCMGILSLIEDNDEFGCFLKCNEGCHHVFERIYDTKQQSHIYIDIHLFYKGIKNSKKVAE